MIDVHCHLEESDYDNIDSILDKCIKNKVNKVIFSGHDEKSNLESLMLSKKHNMVYSSLGYLPDVLENGYPNLEIFEKYIKNNKKVVAIGEIGLDYHWYKDNKELQKKLFVEQLLIAKKYDLPVVIHCRDAINDCYEILKKYKTTNIVMHCYSGSIEMAKKFIEMGAYISIGGVSTFKNAKDIVNVIKEIPLSYIVLETDSPYLTPEPYRGKKNYPYYIPIIAKKIALLKGINEVEVENITTSNACRIFDF